MANKLASKKDIRRSIKNRAKNRHIQSTTRTYIQKLHALVKKQEIKEAESLFPIVNSVIAKSAKINLIKDNTCARKVSRLHRFLKKNGCFGGMVEAVK